MPDKSNSISKMPMAFIGLKTDNLSKLRMLKDILKHLDRISIHLSHVHVFVCNIALIYFIYLFK